MQKNKLIATVGLPRSGKSFWAKQFIKLNKGWLRISNDEFRLMFFNRQFDKGDTKFIDEAREKLVEHFMNRNETNLIIDNTNLSPKRIEEYKTLADKYNYDFEIMDFTHIPLKLCIERDKYREASVGEKVIRQMYNQFLKKDPPKIEHNPHLQDCLICDLDGTLALMCDRSPYDEAKADQDYLNEPVWNVIWSMRHSFSRKSSASPKRNPYLILMSGRDEGRGRQATKTWLKKHDIDYDFLYMRRENDQRSDDIVKEELYNEFIKDKYNVVAVFDDRLRVCRVWNKLGLPLFRVGDPDADF